MSENKVPEQGDVFVYVGRLMVTLGVSDNYTITYTYNSTTKEEPAGLVAMDLATGELVSWPVWPAKEVEFNIKEAFSDES
jgi:hypothetical protein